MRVESRVEKGNRLIRAHDVPRQAAEHGQKVCVDRPWKSQCCATDELRAVSQLTEASSKLLSSKLL